MLGLGLALDMMVASPSGGVAPVPTGIKADGAAFNISELAPSTGTAQTSRVVTPPFNEPFRYFQIVYATFRIRSISVTGRIDDGTTPGTTGNKLAVSGVGTGGVYPGCVLSNGLRVVSQDSGNIGGVGVFTLSGTAAVASGTITGNTGWLAEELFQNGGANITYEAGIEDVVASDISNVPPRIRALWNGADSGVYDYPIWDKTVGYLVSDVTDRGRTSADPLAIWTRCTLPSNLPGLPVNVLATNAFANRGWGNQLVTSGASADPITAAGLPLIGTTATAVITPIAVIMRTDSGKKTVAMLTDSRGAYTGLGGNEPAGYGDQQGDLWGIGSGFARGVHYNAQQHVVNLAKPSEKAHNLSRSPESWRLRRSIMIACNADFMINALGQNDQNATSDPIPTFTASMDLPVGTMLNTSNRVYVVMVGGVAGASAPTSTTLGTNIANSTATLRYMGTDTVLAGRMGAAIAGKKLAINETMKAAKPGIQVIDELLGPYTSSTDNWATAANQADGFNTAYGLGYRALVAINGAGYTGASKTVDCMPFTAGSRTANGGAHDGSRTWLTSASAIAYYATNDGIHKNNLTADLAKAAFVQSLFT